MDIREHVVVGISEHVFMENMQKFPQFLYSVCRFLLPLLLPFLDLKIEVVAIMPSILL
jgi:hypothetical protein